MALARKKLLSEPSFSGGIPQQRSHETRGACVAAHRFFSMSVQQAQVEPFHPRLFRERETMTFADRGWHCCTVASQPSILNVSIYKKGLGIYQEGSR